jgi:NADPH:quinone reductase-like Zn-dependent oxidoreductase
VRERRRVITEEGGNQMKAIVYTKYGSPDVLRLEEVEKSAPKDNEIQVRVQAVSLNAYDLHFVTGTPFFIRMMGVGLLKPKPKPPGADMAGTVEAVGPGVTQFKPGDQVYGCSHGSLAEYACGPEKRFAPKPANLTFEEAAAVPMAALTALQSLRDKGKIRKGQNVLINGASGGVGTFAVQLAKMFETEVTATCRTSKMDFVRSIGADHVIDYTSEDVTKSGRPFDLIFDIAAYRSVRDYRRVMKPGAIYVMAGGSIARLIRLMIISKIGPKNMMTMVADVNREDLLLLKEYLEAGKIKPFIDKRYPLRETAAALWYLKNGLVRGKVVITVP